MLHALFRDIARDCQDNNITMQMITKDSFDIPVTDDGIKFLFKAIAMFAFGKSSTQTLSAKEIDTILMAFSKKFGGYGIEIKLPE